MHFSNKERITYLIVFLLLFFSGIIWLFLHYFCNYYGEFGLETHPMESKVLALHGIVAIFSTFLFGYIWGTHARQRLKMKSKKNKKSGIAISVTLTILCITAGILYYIGNDKIRQITSIAHWVMGIALFFIIILHIFTKISKKKKKMIH